jgi:hypothetical protein
MTIYVKGFKIDRQKLANMLEVEAEDPRIMIGINIVVQKLNRSAYKNIEGGYEPTVDGHRQLVHIIAMDYGDNEEQLREKELEDVDESIRVALPHVLEGPDIWELY